MSDTPDNALRYLLCTALALFVSYLSVAMALPTTPLTLLAKTAEASPSLLDGVSA